MPMMLMIQQLWLAEDLIRSSRKHSGDLNQILSGEFNPKNGHNTNCCYDCFITVRLQVRTSTVEYLQDWS